MPTCPAYLVALSETETKVDELKALVIRAPEDVAWLKVSVDITFPMQEGQSLQDVPGTVLDEPHRVALLCSAREKQACKNFFTHTHLYTLRQ